MVECREDQASAASGEACRRGARQLGKQMAAEPQIAAAPCLGDEILHRSERD
jgi:hypothetical protein